MRKSIRYTFLFLSTAVTLTYQACGQPQHISSSDNSSLVMPSATYFFKCSPDSITTDSPLRRLTKKEYLNTLADLAQPLTKVEKTALLQTIQLKAQLLPEDNAGQYEKFDSRVSTNHIQVQYDIASVFAEQVTSIVNKSIFFGACMSSPTPTMACVKSFISTFGLKTLRRPPTTAEVDELYSFYLNRGTTGLVDLVARLLLHPNFLYHIENEGREFSPNELKLTSYEIASRLSYLYLESMPNALLFAAAESGQLNTISGVEEVINQLFESEQIRVRATIESYVAEWLEFKYKPGFANTAKLQSLATLIGLSNVPDNSLRDAMLKELQDLVTYYVWDVPNGNFSDLMNSDISIVQDDQLAEIYGVPKWIPGQPVQRFPSSERSGLFTRAGSLYTGSEKTSPIHYGVSVIRKVLCDEIPNPSQDIIDDAARDPSIDYLNKTQRDIVHEMTSPNRCIGCHQLINPYGFAAETYDSFGKFRNSFKEYKFDENGNVVNQLTTNSNTEISINGHSMNVSNAVEMNHVLSKSGKAQACFVRNFYRFAQRRTENITDQCGMNRLYTELTRTEGGLKSMFKSMGSDISFLNRKVGK